MLTSWIWRYHIFDSSAPRILMKLSIWKYLHTTALVRKVRRHVELTGLRCRPPIDKWRRLLKTDMCRLKRCVAYRDFEGRSLFSLTWYSSVTATVHVETLCFINIIITVVGSSSSQSSLVNIYWPHNDAMDWQWKRGPQFVCCPQEVKG